MDLLVETCSISLLSFLATNALITSPDESGTSATLAAASGREAGAGVEDWGETCSVG